MYQVKRDFDKSEDCDCPNPCK